MRLQIAAAKGAGLAAVPSICDGACANLSGAWGFQITDEPAVDKFEGVARQPHLRGRPFCSVPLSGLSLVSLWSLSLSLWSLSGLSVFSVPRAIFC